MHSAASSAIARAGEDEKMQAGAADPGGPGGAPPPKPARAAGKAASSGAADAAPVPPRAAFLRALQPLRTAEPPARPRGQVMLALLAGAVPLQAGFAEVAALPPEHWDPRLFGAMNPRAFLPVADTLALLNALGRNAALQAFRAWTDRLSRADMFDEERDRLSALAFGRLLDGDFAWAPALAWVLDRLPWDVVVELARAEFGRDPAPGSHNERYKSVELAILRENLLRAYAPLDEMWRDAFSAAAPGPAAPFPPLAFRVLHLARLHVAARHGAAIPAERVLYRGPGPRDERVLAQGSLGHVVRWAAGPRNAHAVRRSVEAVLRAKAAALPEWTRLLLRVSK
jgi:hypothetical protein